MKTIVTLAITTIIATAGYNPYNATTAEVNKYVSTGGRS